MMAAHTGTLQRHVTVTLSYNGNIRCKYHIFITIRASSARVYFSFSALTLMVG